MAAPSARPTQEGGSATKLLRVVATWLAVADEEDEMKGFNSFTCICDMNKKALTQDHRQGSHFLTEILLQLI